MGPDGAGIFENVEFGADLKQIDRASKGSDERLGAGLVDTGGVFLEVDGEKVEADVGLTEKITETTEDEFPAIGGRPIRTTKNHARR